MKTIISLTVISIVAAVVVSCSGKRPLVGNPAPVGKLTCYEYGESGMMAQPEHAFKITLNDDSATAMLVVSGANDLLLPGMSYDDEVFKKRLFEGGDTITVPATILDSIAQVIIEHKMYNYEDNYTPPFEVSDGTQWHCYASYNDETWLSSGGSNAWPDDNGLSVINNILVTAYRDERAKNP